MATFEKHFTLEEANALLPEIRDIFSEIHAILRSLEDRKEEIEALLQASGSNGGGVAGADLLERLQEIHRLLERITSRGVQVKDLHRGLIDFPHWCQDREIFLCWELGEDSIHFWHDLESGYAGRKRIEEEV